MRLTMVNIDWKEDWNEDFAVEILAECHEDVGKGKKTFEYDVEVGHIVDAKVKVICDSKLQPEQCDKLFEEGDLGVGDKTFEGTYEEILVAVAENLQEDEDE